ncbi:MAG: DUF6265 family protein [Vicinamibacteria bacterium]|jgi:hypothetical protein
MTTRLSLLALALLVPALALAQAPAAPDAKAPEPAAPAAKDEAKGAPVQTPAEAPKEVPKETPKDAGKAPAGIATPPAAGPIAPLAWLNGCWGGNVNQRDFREYWHPLRGGMMVGVGHNAMRDRTVSFEHLRLESKPDGVYYTATTVGQKEVPFKLTDTKKEGPDEIFTFTNGANPFPQIITYRRATDGWLYVEVAGKQAGKDQKVIYPFRRVSCETGEFIRK